MTRLRVHGFTVSADGFGAGPEQDLKHPLGHGGEDLHRWFFPTRTFQAMFGKEKGTTGTDDDFAQRGFENVGAWVMGRHMFTWERGAWADTGWEGWWGDTPPYHSEVFVLTHHARPALEMAGGTVFHFVTEGLETALERARKAAGGRDVRLGGGVATLRAALRAQAVDEMHIAVTPVLLGRGEALFAGLDLPALGYRVEEQVQTEAAMHLVIRNSG